MNRGAKFVILFAQQAVAAITYAFRDMFTTDRAAGAVNGTAAEPGTGNRAVTDTNSKLSLSGGLANFATGGVGAGDPGLWYPAQTTVVGTVLICSVTPGTTSSAGSAGWDTAQAGAIQDAIAFITGSVLQVIAAGTGERVSTYTSSATYIVVVIQLTNGFAFLIKGGTQFTFFNLVRVSRTGAPGTRYPAIGVSTGTVGIFTADDPRIPTTLYTPSPLAYDTFTRADGALGSTETTGPDAQVLAALVWNFVTGIWTISTNKAIATPALGSDAIVNGGFAADTDWSKGAGWTIAAGVATATAASSDLTATVAPLTVGVWYQIQYTISGLSGGNARAVVGGVTLNGYGANQTVVNTYRAKTTAFAIRATGMTGNIDNVSAKALALAELFATVLCATADVIVTAAITLPASGSIVEGLVVNLDSTSSPANFIIAWLDGNDNCILEECVAGLYTTKFTTGITYSAGAILEIHRSGTECRVFYNNLAVNTVQTMTANTNKNHGSFSTSALASIDTVLIWPRGTGNEFATLDSV